MQFHCKACRKAIDARGGRREYHRANYHKKKDGIYRDQTFKRMYGIALDDYNRMFTEQGGLCAICRGECKTGRRLAVDHCHTTGKVRGLLCGRCNQGIGAFLDKTALLDAAIKYLSKP